MGSRFIPADTSASPRRRCPRHRMFLAALLVAVQHQPAVWADVACARSALLDPLPTARTLLPGIRGRDRYHLASRRMLPWRRGWTGTAPIPHRGCSWRGRCGWPLLSVAPGAIRFGAWRSPGWRPAGPPDRSCRRRARSASAVLWWKSPRCRGPSGARGAAAPPPCGGDGCPACGVRRAAAPSSTRARPCR